MVTATLPFWISFISFPCAIVESDVIASTIKPTAAFRIFLLTFRIPYFRIFQEVMNRPPKSPHRAICPIRGVFVRVGILDMLYPL